MSSPYDSLKGEKRTIADEAYRALAWNLQAQGAKDQPVGQYEHEKLLDAIADYLEACTWA